VRKRDEISHPRGIHFLKKEGGEKREESLVPILLTEKKGYRKGGERELVPFLKPFIAAPLEEGKKRGSRTFSVSYLPGKGGESTRGKASQLYFRVGGKKRGKSGFVSWRRREKEKTYRRKGSDGSSKTFSSKRKGKKGKPVPLCP